jgi:four helix bundle protein
VAEGYCRRKTRVYSNHVSIALGSHGEVETFVEIAYRLGYLNDANRDLLDRQLASVGRLLNGLFEALEEKLKREEGGA